YRRRGFGRAMLEHLAREAKRRGCGRFEWTVLDWNQPAIEFYESLGATGLPDWRVCRITGDALKKFGEQPNSGEPSMKTTTAHATLLLLGALCSAPAFACERDATQGPADLVVTNGTVFTADGSDVLHEALAVCDDTIVAVGTREEIARWQGPGTTVIDAGGGA